MPQRYRTKPVEIEALQFDGSEYSAGEIVGWVNTNPADGRRAYLVREGAEHTKRYAREHDRSNGHVLDDAPAFLIVPTAEGDHRVDRDDWVVRGVHGLFVPPCKPDVFTETYVAAEKA